MDFDYYHSTPCLICGEEVPCTSCELIFSTQKICDKCKAAVMKVRKETDIERTLQYTDDEDYREYSGLLTDDA